MCLELLRQRPALAAELLGFVQPSLVPSFRRAQLESGDLSEHAPASYHADALVTLGGETPALAVIVEVQLRPDRRKTRSWPVYLATAYARFDCPTVLLVLCPSERGARWARRPIQLGHPGLVLTPLVLGPAEMPVLTDLGPEDAPELTVISAMVHGAGPDGAKVFTTMLDCMQHVEYEQAQGYIDEVLAVLPDAARKLMEEILKTRQREYKSDYARGYFSQGEAKGEAKAVLTFLSARGIDVPEAARTRISGCTDLDQLDTWIRRAAMAESVDELFE